VITRQVEVYSDANGKEPFWRWIKKLDRPVRARIEVRLRKLAKNQFGDHRGIEEGISELRFHFGSGWRVYYGEDGTTIVILVGGDKDTQTEDIKRAKEYWRDYNARKN